MAGLHPNFQTPVIFKLLVHDSILFHSSSESLLTSYWGSLSASLYMVSSCFPCFMGSSGFSFQWECLLAGLLSNCSIALFIISWNSLMKSSQSALQLTSDELSLSLVSSWSLVWSWGGSSAASHCHTFPSQLLDSPVTSCRSSDRHCGTCSCVFGGISSTQHGACSCVLGGVSSTLLSSFSVPVMFWLLCASDVSPVGCLTVLALLPNAAASPVSCLTVLTSFPDVVPSPVSYLTVLTLLPDAVAPSSIFSCSQPSAVFLHVATCLVIFVYMMSLWWITDAATIFQDTSM